MHGRKLTYLPGLGDELREQNPDGPWRLSAETIEQALLESASAFPHDRPLLDYMLPCWKRVIQAKKSLRAPTPEKEAILQEAKRLCMSYCLFAVTLPDLFGYVHTWGRLGQREPDCLTFPPTVATPTYNTIR